MERTVEEIEMLNDDLNQNREDYDLDPSEFGYFDHVQIRTREPLENETFVRVGYIPYGGRSKNHATKQHEEGVSCYRLIDGRIAKASPFSPQFGEETFEITGEVLQVDTGDGEGWKDLLGADREPLLYNASYVAWFNGSFEEIVS